MARIFLCHATEDKAQVRDVYRRLRAIDGLEPWLDEEDLLPGQDWTREIPRALQKSDFILVFFSHLSVAKRGYVQREMKLALDALQELPEGTIHTIPVRLDDCEMPASFQHYHYANLFAPNGFDHIIRAIRAEIAQQSGPPLPASPQPSPGPSFPERPATPDTALEPLRTVEETLRSGAAASMQPPPKPASPGDDKPLDAVPRREETAPPPVREKDRPEVRRSTTGDAREILGLSRRPKRRLVLVGGVLLCGLVMALYLVLSGQIPSSLPPKLGASSELLVGTWRYTGVELGQPMDILWHLRPDGTETYIVNGVPQGAGTWRYRDAHIYERYPNGRQGEGAIQILDRDHFVVTIVENGVPAQTGVRLLYVRQ